MASMFEKKPDEEEVVTRRVSVKKVVKTDFLE